MKHAHLTTGKGADISNWQGFILYENVWYNVSELEICIINRIALYNLRLKSAD